MGKEPFLSSYKTGNKSKIKFRFLAGVFFISSATLCFEISLTRYFSICQDYHFAFWVVSIAFLGYGASGSFLALFKKYGSVYQDKLLSLSSLLFSLSIMSSFLICNSIPFDFIKLSWDKNQIFFVFLYYFFLSLPFFFAGLTVSFAITTRSVYVNKIYFSDLLGASVGSLLSGFVFFPKGDRGVILFISFLALCASYLFSGRKSFFFKLLLFCLLVIDLGVFIYSPSWLSFRISSFKALPLALKYPNAKHLFTRWNAISRIDILESAAVRYAPGLSLLYEEKLPSQLGLSIDGGELTAITRFRSLQSPALKFLSYLPSSLAYSFLQNPRTLIIEPKGGLDVLAAKAFRASQIKVIESNPLIIKLLGNELASFSGRLYHRKDVHLVSGYSLAFLQKEKNYYDLIVFSLSDVFGSSSTGLYGFGENYLYTLNSFIQVLNRLSPQGIISMSIYLLPPPRQEIRVLATWIEALEMSHKNPASHIVALRSWGTISYFIKNSPFQEQEIQKLKNFADKCLFDLVYYPGIRAEEANIHNKFEKSVYFDLTLQLLNASKRKELYKNYLFQIKPVTDDRPFFFNSFKLNKLNLTYKAFAQKWLPFLQGQFLVFLLFVQSIFIAFILIFIPLYAFRKAKKRKKRDFPKIFFYFGLIGMSFMFVEITFIQKFILFLGHPLYSISVIIFSLLFSSGAGSFFSKRILGQDLRKNLIRVLFFCGGLISLYFFLFPLFYEHFIGSIPLLKIILTFLLIFPLGFLMGFPFPTGIRLLRSYDKSIIPWAWATNAFSSVVNSISALMIAFWAGYNFVLLLAAAGYLLAILFLGFSYHRHKTNA